VPCLITKNGLSPAYSPDAKPKTEVLIYDMGTGEYNTRFIDTIQVLLVG
jgi:hypothetical protein